MVGKQGRDRPGAPLFRLQTSGGHWRKTGKTMRLDLGRAGLPYQDEDGLFADFHANRHTFISNLGKANVPLRMAQKLARHSTPGLTSNVYTHLELSDKASAIGALPSPTERADDQDRETNVLRATGTDNSRAEEAMQGANADCLPHACKISGTTGHKRAQQGTEARRERSNQELPQTVKLQMLGTGRHGAAQVETSGLEPDSVSGCGGKGSANPTPAGGAESGALGADLAALDPDLAVVVEAWPRLSEAVRQAVRELVEAAGALRGNTLAMVRAGELQVTLEMITAAKA
jgi:hypothetical protein